MGTRSLTVLPDYEAGKESAVLYRQMDGYPDGHGQELAEFLVGKRLVNGISVDATTDTAFNGPSCLAASVVAHFKTGIGGFYLYPAGTRDTGEDYIYTILTQPEVDEPIPGVPHTVKRTPGTIGLKVENRRHILFEGTPEDFLRALKDGTINEADEEE